MLLGGAAAWPRVGAGAAGFQGSAHWDYLDPAARTANLRAFGERMR